LSSLFKPLLPPNFTLFKTPEEKGIGILLHSDQDQKKQVDLELK